MNVQFARIPTIADMGFRPAGFRSMGQASLNVNGQVATPGMPATAPSPGPQPAGPAQQVAFFQPTPYFAYPVTYPEVAAPAPVVERAPAVETRTLVIGGAVLLGIVALGLALS